MTTQRRQLYISSNGDKRFLCRERSGSVAVSHQPNAASGGLQVQIDVAEFLAKKNEGPEHQALRHLIGELVDPAHLPSDQQFARDEIVPGKAT
jgi:hypothetical protein